MNDRSFESRYGPWAVITGASDGIGREFAKELARRGLNLVLIARRADELNALCRDLSARHAVECCSLALDLSTPAGCDAVVQFTRELDVGCLVAAAGFGTSGPLVESILQTEREMIAVNCTAVLDLSWHFARRFAQRGRGGIVLMSSLVAFQGAGRAANYAATKAWVQAFSEGLQIELKPLGVDVLSVAPGPVASGFGARARMEMGRAMPAGLVPAEALDALGRQGLVRPGGLSKLLGWSLATMPRSGRVFVMSRIMGRFSRRDIIDPSRAN